MRQSQGSSGSTTMANTTMVPHALTNTGTTTSCLSTSSKSVTDAVQARACIRGKLQVKGFSADTIDIILSSWREGTQTQYQSVTKKWFEFCEKNNCDVISTPVPLATSFLSELFHSGLSYSYINTAGSALSSLLHFDSPIAFGQLPIVKRFMKGVFEKRPALPRYSST